LLGQTKKPGALSSPGFPLEESLALTYPGRVRRAEDAHTAHGGCARAKSGHSDNEDRLQGGGVEPVDDERQFRGPVNAQRPAMLGSSIFARSSEISPESAVSALLRACASASIARCSAAARALVVSY